MFNFVCATVHGNKIGCSQYPAPLKQFCFLESYVTCYYVASQLFIPIGAILDISGLEITMQMVRCLQYFYTTK